MTRSPSDEAREIVERAVLRPKDRARIEQAIIAALSSRDEALSAAKAEVAETFQKYVDANEARIDAEAREAEARKVIEPFARYAERIDGNPTSQGYPDTVSVTLNPEAFSEKQILHLSDLRAARQFLSTPSPETVTEPGKDVAEITAEEIDRETTRIATEKGCDRGTFTVCWGEQEQGLQCKCKAEAIAALSQFQRSEGK